MRCEYCNCVSIHLDGCPNCEPKLQDNNSIICKICDNAIKEQEEYIINKLSNTAHVNCFSTIDDLIEFLQLDIFEK